MKNDSRNEFEKSGDQKDIGLFGEFVGMLKLNKKYWLIPLVIILLLFGVLIFLGSTAARTVHIHAVLKQDSDFPVNANINLQTAGQSSEQN